MKAIIPVAGVGERLKPFTHTTPKPLLSLAGKPIISHIIDWLLDQGVSELVLVIGYKGEQIRNYVTRKYDVPTYFVEQKELNGLGYAVYLALEYIGNEPFLIVLGDTIIEADLRDLLNSDVNHIGITRVRDPRRFGVVELDGKKIIGMEEKPEKPKSDWIIAGFYHILSRNKLKESIEYLIERKILTRGEIQLTDALKLMLDSGEKFEGFVLTGWYDCGKPETLLETHRHLLEKNGNVTSLEGNIIIPPVYVADSAKVESSIVGPYVSIGENAQLERVVLRNSIVGDGAMLKNCILEDSILGNDSTFWGRPHRLNLGDSSKVELEWE